MTIEEASQRYCIPIKILKEYEAMGLCDSVKKVMGDWQYDETDLERLSMIITLNDCGYTKQEIESYMKLMIQGKSTEQERMSMLNKRRFSMLDELHFKQRQLDYLDYLRHEIQKDERKCCKNE